MRSKLAVLILFASALAVALASLGFGMYDRHHAKADAVREATALADTLAANSAASLAFNDDTAALEILGALSTEPHIRLAALYDPSGRKFVAFPSQAADRAPSLPADGAYFDQDSLMLVRGVRLNGERTGSIVLVYGLEDLHSTFVLYAKIASLVLLLSVGFAFFVSLRLAEAISGPLVRLAAVARRISAEKDYSVRAVIRADGEAGLLVGAFNEMLERIESHESALNSALSSLEQSQERYALAARGANDGLWDWDLASNRIYFSPRWDHMLGEKVSENWSTPEDWLEHIHPDDRERVRKEFATHLKGGTPELVSEYRMRPKGGGHVWMLSRGIAVRNAVGVAVRMAGSQTDVTEGKIADPLTRIPNRLYFMDRLESAIEIFRHKESTFAVLFVDLDEFKLVNDSLGHAAGDDLLIDVAGRLRASIRTALRPGVQASSVVARVGGDEFAILLTDVQTQDDPAVVASRILERLGEPFHLEGRRMFVSASIGIALSATGSTPEDLIRNADTAMYHAKANGKGRAEFFSDAMRERVVTRFETETGLRKAIDANQLVLHYQPLLMVNDCRLCGFEALLRWEHPERGLIPPGEFIPIAEESELIIPIGRWVLLEACRQMAQWQAEFADCQDLKIAVNVSSRQLCDPRLVQDVQFALDESGLSAESLAIEITESSLIGNIEETIVTLERLKAMGVHLEIDDFGTGYSSLSYLRRLPFDTLKIDRSFVRELSSEGDGVDMVRAIVEMARSLHLDVIAEGVETEEQLAQLERVGCGRVQGFLFSRPLEAAKASKVCRAGCLVLPHYSEQNRVSAFV